MTYRLLEQKISDKFYLLDGKGNCVLDVAGNEITVDKQISRYNTFYYVENVEDEDDYEVFDNIEDALDYIKNNNIELEY